MLIREAKASDLKTIQQLNYQLFEKEYAEYDRLLNREWTFGPKGTAYYKKRIAKRCVLLAFEGRKTVGYICFALTKGELYRLLPKTAELENMLVLEEHRSRGIGRALVDAFLAWCERKKVGKIRVQATAQNARAIKFYKRCGFHEYTLILERDL